MMDKITTVKSTLGQDYMQELESYKSFLNDVKDVGSVDRLNTVIESYRDTDADITVELDNDESYTQALDDNSLDEAQQVVEMFINEQIDYNLNRLKEYVKGNLI